MADELMYFPNDYEHNYPVCKLQVVIDSFGHSTESNQSKFKKCT